MLVCFYRDLAFILQLVETPSRAVYDPRMQYVSASHTALSIRSDGEFLARHFCYLCGGLIVKSALGQEIGEATSSHFGSNCTLFEVPG